MTPMQRKRFALEDKKRQQSTAKAKKQEVLERRKQSGVNVATRVQVAQQRNKPEF
jgi:hypothetical protein